MGSAVVDGMPIVRFSALQRAEIAEIARPRVPRRSVGGVSVLFNEPKLLKLSLFASHT